MLLRRTLSGQMVLRLNHGLSLSREPRCPPETRPSWTSLCSRQDGKPMLFLESCLSAWGDIRNLVQAEARSPLQLIDQGHATM